MIALIKPELGHPEKGTYKEGESCEFVAKCMGLNHSQELEAFEFRTILNLRVLA